MLCQGAGREDLTAITLLATPEGVVDTLAAGITYDGLDSNPEFGVSVVEDVKRFLDLVLNELADEFDFFDKFGIEYDTIELAKSVCYVDLEIYLSTAMKNRRETENGRTPVNDAPFFYPIRGILSRLSASIQNKMREEVNDEKK